jgi:hypothetical protein
MDEQKQQVAQRVKEANNILVTVSANPSVDQLAACIGLTVALNKMGKHATAVFSGQVPSILEFLQPEKTIEKNTDSLRDFIIALDKSKADKLRYKVEDRVVKIFITPYRTSISDKDLEFSQGDFNVDVVVALGVHNQSDLDQAITSHGRILHDATVITLNNKAGGELGILNWLEPTGSSLSELAMQLLDLLDNTILDEQIATAMLTGIVAETERFSNAKTTPRTMSISAELMSAGANQQLVATKLQAPTASLPAAPAPQTHEISPKDVTAEDDHKSQDGTLEITHDEPQLSKSSKGTPTNDLADPNEDYNQGGNVPSESIMDSTPSPQIHIDEHGGLHTSDDMPADSPKNEPMPPIRHHAEPPKMILEPPTLGGQLTASGMPDAYELLPSDPLTLPSIDAPATPSMPAVGTTIMPPHQPDDMLDEFQQAAADTPTPLDQPAQSNDMPSPLNPFAQNKTLSELENDVRSVHVNAPSPVADLPAPSFSVTPVAPPANLHTSVLSNPNPPMPIVVPPEADDELVTLQGARDAVADAINGVDSPLPPVAALNAQPVDLPIGSNAAPEAPALVTPVLPPVAPAPVWGAAPAGPQPNFATPPAMQMPNLQPPAAYGQSGQTDEPNAPPVPPPMMPNLG